MRESRIELKPELYYRRQRQLARIDRFLVKFERDAPFLYYGFLVGIAMFFAGLLLKVLELVQ